MYFKGDFHNHSIESDGNLSPIDVVKRAKSKHIDIMSLTDHDTTDGVLDAIKEGISLNVKVIPGMELSTSFNNESIHILAYFKDDCYLKEEFQTYLKNLTNYRVERAKKIVDLLKIHFNIVLDYKNVLKIAEGVVARPHIAKAIIDAGYPYSIDYIFQNIINEDSPAYIPNKKLTTKDGISLLKEFNAVVVLAHPVLIKKSPVEELLKLDFDGIEAIYPLNTKEKTNEYLKLAKKYNKIITAGSDFHNLNIGDNKHSDIGTSTLDSKNIEIFLNKLL